MPPTSFTLTPDPQSGLRSFKAEFEPPVEGFFSGFKLAINRVDQNGDDIDSEENILENSLISLPLSIGRDERNRSLTFAQYGVVYALRLNTQSVTGQDSLWDLSVHVITGIN